MKRRWLAPVGLVFVIAVVLAWPALSFAQVQVQVIMSGGFSAAYRELLPTFEKATGIRVNTTSGPSQGNGPNTIGAQLRRGVPADVVIMSREGLNELIAEGKIIPRTDVDLAQSSLGMAVRTGVPKPDISTVDAFKQTLLHAKSITFPGSTTGIYLMTKLFPQLGIDKEIAGKITETDVAVPNGKFEIAIQPVSELLDVPAFDFVGPIPVEIQYISVFSSAIVTGSKEPEASKRLIAYLASESATEAIKKSGMEPLRAK
jgi:molybdate transport system substrate-binding protein